MSFLRANQRTMTALFPHPGNPTHLIPKRFPGPVITEVAFKVTQTTVIYDRVISGGDASGWTVTINGVPEAVISVLNGAPTDIVVTYALQVIGDDIRVTYDGNGDWAADNGTGKVRPIDASGVIV